MSLKSKRYKFYQVVRLPKSQILDKQHILNTYYAGGIVSSIRFRRGRVYAPRRRVLGVQEGTVIWGGPRHTWWRGVLRKGMKWCGIIVY